MNLSGRRQLLLSVLRPSIEYGSEMKCNIHVSQASALESILLGGAKRSLDARQCSWWQTVAQQKVE